jgi:hypothetical protein
LVSAFDGSDTDGSAGSDAVADVEASTWGAGVLFSCADASPAASVVFAPSEMVSFLSVMLRSTMDKRDG